MKASKKLFALLAVLTMALTLMPFGAPAMAQNDLTINVTPNPVTMYQSDTPTVTVTSVQFGGSQIPLNDPNLQLSATTSNPSLSATGTSAIVLKWIGSALSSGTTAFLQVTATYTIGTTTYEGHVIVPVTINPDQLTVTPSITSQVIYTATPNNTATVSATFIFNGVQITNPSTVQWTSDPSTLVNFGSATSSTSTVTGLTATTGTIIVTAQNGGATATAALPITIANHSIKVQVPGAPSTMDLHDTLQLNPTVVFDNGSLPLPSDASVQFGYSSSNPTAVSVDNNGLLTATGFGSATITVSATATWGAGPQTATDMYSFSVVVSPQFDLSVAPTQVTLQPGTTALLTATVHTNLSGTPNYTWSSDNPLVYFVGGNTGAQVTIKASSNIINPDTANITVTASLGGQTKSAIVSVTITPAQPPTYTFGATFKEGTSTTATVGGSFVLTGSVVTNDPSFDATKVVYDWSSLNPSVVGVNVNPNDASKATVTALAAGQGTIKLVVSYPGYTPVTLYFSVTVNAPAQPPTYTFGATFKEGTSTTATVGGSFVLTGSVVTNDPSFDATKVVYDWSSLNPSVVGVNVNPNDASKATVTALAAGQGTIKLVVSYPGYTPVTLYFSVTVNAPAPGPITGVTLANASGKWVQAGSQWLYQVSYDVFNAPQNAQNLIVDLLSPTGSVLAQSALSFRQVSVSFADAWNTLNGKDSVLTVKLENSTASAVVPINFYNVQSSLASSYKSGDYGTITVTVSLVTGDKLTSTPMLALVHGSGVTGTIIPLTVSSSDPTIATGIIKNFRFTGAANDKWYLVESGADLKTAYASTKITRTAFAFNPTSVLVTGAPFFDTGKVYIADANGNSIPSNTFVQVVFNNATSTVTVYSDDNGSFIRLSLPTPSVVGSYTATVTTSNAQYNQIDGKGTFTIVYAQALQLGDMNTSTIGTAYINAFVAGQGNATIQKMWITVTDPNGVLDPYTPYSVANGSEVKVYANGIYCTKPDPTDDYWTGFSGPIATIGINLVQGGTFTVNVKVQMSNGAVFTQTRNYTNKVYADTMVVTPTVPVYGSTATLTITVKNWAGYPVNNAVIAVDGNQITPVEGAFVNNGVYTIVVPGKYLTYGYHKVSIYDQNGNLMALDYFFALAKNTLNVSLTPTTVIAGGLVNGVVTDANGNAVNGIAIVNTKAGIDYVVPVINGKFIIDTSDSKFTTAKSYTVNVVDSSYQNMGSASFTVVLPVTIVSPTDGKVNNFVSDSIVVTVTSGLAANNLSVVPSQVYQVVNNGAPTKQYCATLTNLNETIEGNKATFTFTATADPSIGCAKLLVMYGNYQVASFQFGAPALKLMQTATWYMGDTVPLQAKITDAHGQPVAGVTVGAQQVGYFNLTAKTGTDGIADFGNVYLNVAGNVVVSANVNGLDLTDKVSVLPQRPAQDLSVTVTPTVVTAGKDTVLTLTLVGSDGKPVQAGKSAMVAVGPYVYTGLVGANGMVAVKVSGDAFTGTVVAGIVKVDGYNASTFTVGVMPAPVPVTPDLVVTITPTSVQAGADSVITLKLAGSDGKAIDAGTNAIVIVGADTYNVVVGVNGMVNVTLKASTLTGTAVSGVVIVNGYNKGTFTLGVTQAVKPAVVIELTVGMDVYTVNGETKFWDATPYIKEGRTMVPIRHLAEALGFKADWDFSDPANKMVFIFKADQDPEKDKEHPFILLIIGQPTAMVSGNLVALDVAPEILNGRTMVPLRFVVETLGYKVEWLGNTVRLYK